MSLEAGYELATDINKGKIRQESSSQVRHSLVRPAPPLEESKSTVCSKGCLWNKLSCFCSQLCMCICHFVGTVSFVGPDMLQPNRFFHMHPLSAVLQAVRTDDKGLRGLLLENHLSHFACLGDCHDFCPDICASALISLRLIQLLESGMAAEDRGVLHVGMLLSWWVTCHEQVKNFTSLIKHLPTGHLTVTSMLVCPELDPARTEAPHLADCHSKRAAAILSDLAIPRRRHRPTAGPELPEQF